MSDRLEWKDVPPCFVPADGERIPTSYARGVGGVYFVGRGTTVGLRVSWYVPDAMPDVKVPIYADVTARSVREMAEHHNKTTNQED